MEVTRQSKTRQLIDKVYIELKEGLETEIRVPGGEESREPKKEHSQGKERANK